MNDILKLLEDDGFNFEVEVGWKDKYRKKIIREAMKKLKDNGDKLTLLNVKKLYRCFTILDSLKSVFYSIPVLIEPESKYYTEEFFNYMDEYVIDTTKRIITGIIEAFGKKEKLDTFYKYLLLSSMYSKKEIEEMGHEDVISMYYKKEIEEMGHEDNNSITN